MSDLGSYAFHKLFEDHLITVYERLGYKSEDEEDYFIMRDKNIAVKVSLIDYTDVESARKKADEALSDIKKTKPKYFVMTDLNTYDIYFDGEYYDTLSFPLSASDLKALYESVTNDD